MPSVLALILVGGSVAFGVLQPEGQTHHDLATLASPLRGSSRRSSSLQHDAEISARNAADVHDKHGEASRNWASFLSSERIAHGKDENGFLHSAWLEKAEEVLGSAGQNLEGTLEKHVNDLAAYEEPEAQKPKDEQKKEPKESSPGKKGDRRKQMYFRPVSTTLWCVMGLTITCLVLYTVLAFARNADELSGRNEPSVFTETLAVASRATAFPPMLCMLFVGCRMYVLATTEGLGEPPIWVKGCMIAASVGVVLQVLLVLVLPTFTIREDTTEKFSEIAGEENDVHPMLNEHRYSYDGAKIATWFVQSFSLLLIYGGVVGVIVGIVTFPQGTTKVSPAVICTMILSTIYFVTYLALWVVRTSTAKGGENQHLRNAAQCAVNSVQKAPMMAILFLASRMRALQLDPPHGMPPFWAQCCFFTMTGMLFLEVITAAYVGWTGKESHGYYGYHLYHAHPLAHFCQHMFALINYLCLIPVIVAIYVMKTSSGDYYPLSPMMIALLWLEGLYFGVLLVRWVVFFLQDVCKKELRSAQETVLAAGISISFCPLLCVLFVACRMRALQISQQKGNPQRWAQDCFFMCVFATYVQAFCCLALPMFTGAATQVDGDGNPTYDLRPMIGAYAVCIVKYVALLCLHGGVLAVSISIFTITPESAMSSAGTNRGVKEVLVAVLWTMLILLIATLASSAKAVGMAVKMGIEAVAKPVLGVDVTVGKANLSVCEGYVNVAGLRVHNPDEQEWASKYIMKVDQLVVKLSLWRLVKTFGGQFEVTTCVLKGIDVCYEKNIGQSSNINYVVDHIENLVKQAGLDKLAVSDDTSAPLKEQMRQCSEDCEKMMNLKPPGIILQTLLIEDVGAGALIQGAAIHAQIGNIDFPDFMKDQCSGKEVCEIGDIVSIVVKIIFRTVLANRKIAMQGAAVAGKVAIAGIKQAGSAIKNVVSRNLSARDPTTESPAPASTSPRKS